MVGIAWTSQGLLPPKFQRKALPRGQHFAPAYMVKK